MISLSRPIRRAAQCLAHVAGHRGRARVFRWQGAQIGEQTRLFLHSLGSEPYLVRVDRHSTVCAGVQFITHDGATWVFRDALPSSSSVTRFGAIWIRENCFVGINAVILPNVVVGPDSVVGAGAVVTRSVPPGVVVAGNPARVVCSLSDYRDKCVAESPELDVTRNRSRQLAEICWSRLERQLDESHKETASPPGATH